MISIKKSMILARWMLCIIFSPLFLLEANATAPQKLNPGQCNDTSTTECTNVCQSPKVRACTSTSAAIGTCTCKFAQGHCSASDTSSCPPCSSGLPISCKANGTCGCITQNTCTSTLVSGSYVLDLPTQCEPCLQGEIMGCSSMLTGGEGSAGFNKIPGVCQCFNRTAFVPYPKPCPCPAGQTFVSNFVGPQGFMCVCQWPNSSWIK